MAPSKSPQKGSPVRETAPKKKPKPGAVDPPAEAPGSRVKRPSAAKKAAQTSADDRFRKARRCSVLLKHLSDPTRLQMALLLDESDRHVGWLSEFLRQSQPAVSHHLALLRHGGVIQRRRLGKNNIYSLTETGRQLTSVVKGLFD